MYIPVTPLPKPRMTQRDKWAQRPAVVAYRAYKDELRLHSVPQQESYWLVFLMPMPNSWSGKKRAKMDGQPHQQKPDVDNLIKGFFDAIVEEDSHIYEVHAKKIWITMPGILVGRENYERISKTIEITKTRPDAVEEPSQAPEPTLKGVAGNRSLRVRGVQPRTRTG